MRKPDTTTAEQYRTFLELKMLPYLNAWLSRPELMGAHTGFEDARSEIKELLGHD